MGSDVRTGPGPRVGTWGSHGAHCVPCIRGAAQGREVPVGCRCHLLEQEEEAAWLAGAFPGSVHTPLRAFGSGLRPRLPAQPERFAVGKGAGALPCFPFLFPSE